MNPYPKSSSHEPTAPTLQPSTSPLAGVEGMMADAIFKLRVNQLVTTLRGQGLDKESDTMLSIMESLVIAGEIPFSEFMERVQNLFPHVFDQIDVQLRDNLLRMLKD